jgi:pyruvate/2-oxoglutarate dehydrogenase complex dihydrolipoamide acyltransferase (E2) component
VKAHNHKGYQVVPFPTMRRAKPLIHALTEVDVTTPRQSLHAHKLQTGETLSFTAFIIACVARAAAEHKRVHAYRQGGRHLVLFDDVDVNTLVEHDLGDYQAATPYVIRAANRKPVRALHEELRAAQAAGASYARIQRLSVYLPRVIRTLFWRACNRSPRLKQRIGGTVSVTALGMVGKGIAGWGIPISDYTLTITVGGIADKPAVFDGRIEGRQMLCLTVSADHTVVDGAPLVRFVRRLKELIESGYGLPEAGVSGVVGRQSPEVTPARPA